ncbi:hypothetical protein GGG16DRAFT_86703 [Schizophyllum commune]
MSSPPSLPERRPESPAMPSASSPSPPPPAIPSAVAPAVANPFDGPDSPPPASTAEPQHAPSTGQTEQPADPRVAALKAMFPDFDDQILLSVLDSVNGNQDRAIDMLLGMSDPEYKATAAPEAPSRPQTQEDLDAEFARRLMLEEQEANDRAAAMYYEQQQSRYASSGWQPQSGPGGTTNNAPNSGNDTMSDIQAQVKQFGETAGKTLGSLFSKVKAKIQELDTNNNGGGASGSQASQQQQQQQQAQWAASPNANYQPYRRSQESSARRSHEAAAAHYEDSEPIRLGSPPAEAGRSSQGYDVSPSPSPAPRPTSRSSRPIDGGKLGILPKRPVSLVRDPSPKPSDDDDDLEYAENPFETEDKGVKPAK